MTKYFAASTKGFYDNTINPTIPGDAVEITDKKWADLINASSQGKMISSDKNGNPVAIDYPKPTEDEIKKIYEAAASEYLNSTSKAWGYDNIVSAVSYVVSTNLQFKTEGQILSDWRDAVWAKTFQVENTKPLPLNVESFLALLPQAPSRPNEGN